MCCEAWASVSTAPNHCLHPVPPPPCRLLQAQSQGASGHYHNPAGGCAETQIAAQRPAGRPGARLVTTKELWANWIVGLLARETANPGQRAPAVACLRLILGRAGQPALALRGEGRRSSERHLLGRTCGAPMHGQNCLQQGSRHRLGHGGAGGAARVLGGCPQQRDRQPRPSRRDSPGRRLRWRETRQQEGLLLPANAGRNKNLPTH